MKSKRMKSGIIVFLLIGMMFFLLIPNTNYQAETSYTWDDTDDSKKSIRGSSITDFRIHVDGNWTETAATYEWCTGSGTYNDPYTIQNLIIDANGSGYGILINNATEYFRIENCTVFNSTSVGIKLCSVKNGEVIDNNVYSNIDPNPCFVEDGDGIHLYYCNENIVIGNNCTGNSGDGIHLYGCNENIVIGNNCTGNSGDGIHLSVCNENIVIGNNCTGNDDGIRISASYSDGSNNNIIIYNNCSENSDNGISVYDYNNMNRNNIIIYNNCSENSGNGIYLYGSDYNTVTGNNCTENFRDGIRIYYYSRYNNVTGNNCKKNYDYGIYLYYNSEYNEVYNNFLIKNTDGCLKDLGRNNNIYNNTCVLTLIASFLVNTTVIEVGQSVEFTDRTSGGNAPLVYQWNFGDGSLDSIAQNPVHRYISLGTYKAILIVTDADKDVSISTKTILVRDTTNPVLTSPSDITYKEGITGHNITWSATDINPNNYVIYKDSQEIASGNWDSNNQITINVDGLSTGIYNYTIIIYDTSGNSARHTVIVTIIAMPITEGPVIIYLLLIVSTVALVTIATIIFWKRKRRKQLIVGLVPPTLKH